MQVTKEYRNLRHHCIAELTTTPGTILSVQHRRFLVLVLVFELRKSPCILQNTAPTLLMSRLSLWSRVERASQNTSMNWNWPAIRGIMTLVAVLELSTSQLIENTSNQLIKINP